MNDEKLVSIIIPVYNVEDYLDRCIESVTNQTYTNIEVIIIDDGSSDNSLKICQKWSNTHSIIKLYHHENHGLSYTRNYGVTVANGEYFAFVDADDWVDKDYIRLMMEAATQEDADVAVCDYVKLIDEEKNYIGCGVRKGPDFIARMLTTSCAAWNKLYRRRFWVENELGYPQGYDEDTALFPAIVLLANGMVCVKQDLYTYVKRGGSITSDMAKRLGYADTLQRGADLIKDKGCWEANSKQLWRYYIKWICHALSPCIGKADRNFYTQVLNSFTEFLKHNFDRPVYRACVWGSYNLGRIVRETSVLGDPWLRFQYSTIESITEVGAGFPVDKKNRELSYREFMIKRDKEKALWTVLEQEKPQYFILDFLEERDRVKEGDYNFDSWKKSCDKFIVLLKNYFQPNQIILVENYMTEHYMVGHDFIEFENISEIININAELKKCYRYFENNFAGIHRINVKEESDYFTDYNYEYGCYPWHLNDEINYVIANKINVCLGEK